jgi:hypothetical protein
MSDPLTKDIPNDPAAYLYGPQGGEASRTEGGTNRDGGVSLFGSSRTGGGEREDTTQIATTDREGTDQAGNTAQDSASR